MLEHVLSVLLPITVQLQSLSVIIASAFHVSTMMIALPWIPKKGIAWLGNVPIALMILIVPHQALLNVIMAFVPHVLEILNVLVFLSLIKSPSVVRESVSSALKNVTLVIVLIV